MHTQKLGGRSVRTTDVTVCNRRLHRSCLIGTHFPLQLYCTLAPCSCTKLRQVLNSSKDLSPTLHLVDPCLRN